MTGKELIKETTEWVTRIHENAEHLIRTAYWAKRIDASAGEAVILACLTHDIERAFQFSRSPSRDNSKEQWNDDKYLAWHGQRSAQFTAQFLKDRDVPDELIQHTMQLIKKHEVGGDYDENLVKDADSVALLEINSVLLENWVPKNLSKERVRKKLDQVFDRISSSQAKGFAQPFYKKAIAQLVNK